MASLYWDHIVHYVNDLDAAIKQFEKKGLIAFHGGSHKQWGTYNALSYFDLSYIEFLSVEDRALAEQIDVPNDVVKDSIKLLPKHEVISRIALRTDDIEQIASDLAKTELALSPIMDGKRLDAQGNLIEWRMMTIAGDFAGLPYPFIIQWAGTDQERKAKLVETGIIQKHPAGDAIIAQGRFEVTDPESVANHWNKLFGFEILKKQQDSVKLGIGTQTLVFKKGEDNRLNSIIIETDSNELHGEKLRIGEGEYIFQNADLK